MKLNNPSFLNECPSEKKKSLDKKLHNWTHSENVVDGKSDISEKNKNSIPKFLGNGNRLSESIKPNLSIICLEETNFKIVPMAILISILWEL